MNFYYSMVREIVTTSPVNVTFQELQKMRNTMKHSRGTFISAKVSDRQKSTPFIHGTEDKKSE
jgi:hypothetical protein